MRKAGPDYRLVVENAAPGVGAEYVEYLPILQVWMPGENGEVQVGKVFKSPLGYWSFALEDGIERGMCTTEHGAAWELVRAFTGGSLTPPTSGEFSTNPKSIGHKNGSVRTHPSFGHVMINRVNSSGARLYGSEMEHNVFYELSIGRSKHYRDLSTDWYHSGENLVTVHLSAAQFVGLMTSLNVADGSPCTIHRVLGDTMPEIPHVSAYDLFQEEISASGKEALQKIQEATKEIEALTASLSGKKKDAIAEAISSLGRYVRDSVPFIETQVRRKVEKDVAAGKAEVDACLSSMVTRLGMQSLGEKVRERQLENFGHLLSPADFVPSPADFGVTPEMLEAAEEELEEELDNRTAQERSDDEFLIKCGR